MAAAMDKSIDVLVQVSVAGSGVAPAWVGIRDALRGVGFSLDVLVSGPDCFVCAADPCDAEQLRALLTHDVQLGRARVSVSPWPGSTAFPDGVVHPRLLLRASPATGKLAADDFVDFVHAVQGVGLAKTGKAQIFRVVEEAPDPTKVFGLLGRPFDYGAGSAVCELVTPSPRPTMAPSAAPVVEAVVADDVPEDQRAAVLGLVPKALRVLPKIELEPVAGRYGFFSVLGGVGAEGRSRDACVATLTEGTEPFTVKGHGVVFRLDPSGVPTPDVPTPVVPSRVIVWHDAENCPLPKKYIARRRDGRPVTDGRERVKFVELDQAPRGDVRGDVAVAEVLREALRCVLPADHDMLAMDATTLRSRVRSVEYNFVLHWKAANLFHPSTACKNGLLAATNNGLIDPGSKKDAVDRVIKDGMMGMVRRMEDFSVEQKANTLVVLVTSDRDFASAVSHVTSHGFPVVVIASRDANPSGEFLRSVPERMRSLAWLEIVERSREARASAGASVRPPTSPSTPPRRQPRLQPARPGTAPSRRPATPEPSVTDEVVREPILPPVATFLGGVGRLQRLDAALAAIHPSLVARLLRETTTQDGKKKSQSYLTVVADAAAGRAGAAAATPDDLGEETAERARKVVKEFVESIETKAVKVPGIIEPTLAQDRLLADVARAGDVEVFIPGLSHIAPDRQLPPQRVYMVCSSAEVDEAAVHRLAKSCGVRLMQRVFPVSDHIASANIKAKGTDFEPEKQRLFAATDEHLRFFDPAKPIPLLDGVTVSATVVLGRFKDEGDVEPTKAYLDRLSRVVKEVEMPHKLKSIIILTWGVYIRPRLLAVADSLRVGRIQQQKTESQRGTFMRITGSERAACRAESELHRIFDSIKPLSCPVEKTGPVAGADLHATEGVR